MSLLSQKPPINPPPPPVPVRVTAPEYRGVTVNSSYEPSQNLIAHVTGSPWTIEYYSQVLDKDSPVQAFSFDLSPSVQQYKKIRQFILKVTSPLSTSQDGENQLNSTGTAYVYSCLIPNKGDVFLADIGDGREGIFGVTDVKRMSMFKDKVHEIEYAWINYVSQPYVDNLAAKTVDTVVFVYDYMEYGQNPLIHEQTYTNLLNLGQQMRQICQNYFNEFVSNEYKTLIVPEQMNVVYDPYLTNAVLSFFDTRDAPEIIQCRRLNTGGDDVCKSKTIWDVLTQKNMMLFKRIGTKIALVHARQFDRNPMYEGIFSSGVYYVAYLTDPVLSTDAKRRSYTKTISANLTPPLEPTPPATPGPALIPALAATDAYVFSDGFYTCADGLSLLEIQVWNYLESRAIDLDTVVLLATAYPGWSDMERYYYGPVVMILMKAILRST